MAQFQTTPVPPWRRFFGGSHVFLFRYRFAVQKTAQQNTPQFDPFWEETLSVSSISTDPSDFQSNAKPFRIFSPNISHFHELPLTLSALPRPGLPSSAVFRLPSQPPCALPPPCASFRPVFGRGCLGCSAAGHRKNPSVGRRKDPVPRAENTLGRSPESRGGLLGPFFRRSQPSKRGLKTRPFKIMTKRK